MERIMSVEDKIRRAEEIYSKRRENEYRMKNARVTVENSENILVNKRLKKMIIQIIICMVSYFIFYYSTINNNVFSEEFKNQCKEILAYDISLNEMYQKISAQIILIKEKYQQMIENIEQDDNKKEEQNNEEIVNQNKNVEAETTEENIGGSTEEIPNSDVNVKEENELTEEEQMKKDSEEIKEKISFLKPVEGIVTSNFGWRNPTVSTVSKYHTGIDIGVEEGTNIISATNGKVVLASSEGAYGNHLKIQVDDIEIIYAHCLSLEVKEGDKITQGQIIAKVGNTGNSTGPHLHFEIRRNKRYVDPKLIIDF